MDRIHTNRKYTVIVSAFQESNTAEDNYIATEQLYHFIENAHCHLHAIRAIGAYKGGSELSFVVHTDDMANVAEIRRNAFLVNNQEAILVRHNYKHEVKLHCNDGVNLMIGSHFIKCKRKPVDMSYTVLNGKDYYIVGEAS